MLRQVALDTETTGKTDDGTPGDHRIIEVGCVEIVDRKITGRSLRFLVNPDRPVDEEAVAVHGITDAMLADKPHFKDIAPELIDFIRGSELLIHNARFDTSFLDKEWMLLNLSERTADMCRITDTLTLARHYNPNNQVNLDNLCHLYDIDNSRRTQHGALLDAELLAEVYLAMTGGQSSFDFGEEKKTVAVRQWHRPQGARLPRMQVEKPRHLLHVQTMLQLAQNNKKQELPDGAGFMAGSDWSSDFDMPYLAKGKEEGKKDYARRLKEQRDEMLLKLLDETDRALLQKVNEKEDALAKAWLERVLHG